MGVLPYLRERNMPHVLCPGCAHGIVLRALLEAIDRLGLDQDRVALVAGIGCSSRLVGYADFCTLHTTHGRAPAFATGLKLARPELNVVVLTGDGDGLAIGGNHLIHAARRNIGLTCLLFNNAVYGMTGGQLAPTTPSGALASTAPYGSLEPPFDACKLLAAAGATFVARALAYRPMLLTDLIARALQHRGFAFIEVISDCPEYFGRYNGLGGGPEMLMGMPRYEADIGALLAAKRVVPHLPVPAPPAGLPVGLLHQEERPEFSAVCRRAIQEAASKAEDGRGPGETHGEAGRRAGKASSGGNGLFPVPVPKARERWMVGDGSTGREGWRPLGG